MNMEESVNEKKSMIVKNLYFHLFSSNIAIPELLNKFQWLYISY